MSKIKDLEKRLELICNLVDETFFEYDEGEDCYCIPDKYKDYKSIIWEVFYIADMGELSEDDDK